MSAVIEAVGKLRQVVYFTPEYYTMPEGGRVIEERVAGLPLVEI